MADFERRFSGNRCRQGPSPSIDPDEFEHMMGLLEEENFAELSARIFDFPHFPPHNQSNSASGEKHCTTAEHNEFRGVDGSIIDTEEALRRLDVVIKRLELEKFREVAWNLVNNRRWLVILDWKTLEFDALTEVTVSALGHDTLIPDPSMVILYYPTFTGVDNQISFGECKIGMDLNIAPEKLERIATLKDLNLEDFIKETEVRISTSGGGTEPCELKCKKGILCGSVEYCINDVICGLPILEIS